MPSGPKYYVNSPVSGTTYYAPMGYGIIASSGTTVQTTVKAWSGANGTGSLVAVSTLTAIVRNQTQGQDFSFSGNGFNTANAQHTATNSTDWYKPGGKYSGSGVGSLEISISSYTGSAFVPNVTSFTPTVGAPGTSVTISGSHFTDASFVKFNGTSASYTVNNDSTITATVPSGASAGPIQVGNQSGSDTSSTNFTPNTVYGDTGAALQAGCLIYGDNGSALVQAEMWADTGTGWVQIA